MGQKWALGITVVCPASLFAVIFLLIRHSCNMIHSPGGFQGDHQYGPNVSTLMGPRSALLMEPGPSGEHVYPALGFPVCKMGALVSAFSGSKSASESLALLPQALIARGERLLFPLVALSQQRESMCLVTHQ